MNEQEYIERLKKENQILQEKLDKVQQGKQRSKKWKRWLFRKSSTPLLGKRLKNSISTAINEFKEYKTVSVDTASDVSASVLWRFTRIGLFTILFAVLPSVVLILQTFLLFNQNGLVESQNELATAQRKSSLVFVMDNILGDLNEELKYKGVNSSNDISQTLEARIVSLSRAMQPYELRDGDGDLISEKTSPERGQLVYSLVRSDIGNQSLTDIFNAGDFKYTYLKEASLERAYLRYAKLDYANFEYANMPNANLGYCELREVQMKKVNLSEANLSRAKLINGDLSNAELQSSDFTHANLSGATLEGANLSEAKLWGTKLMDANLEDTVLDNVIVHRQDWLTYIKDSLDVRGAGDIQDTYRVKKQGKQQFVLVRR